MPLSGRLGVVSDEGDGERCEWIGHGRVAYHAAGRRHTLCAAGPEPASYVIFKWRAAASRDPTRQIGSGVFQLFGSDTGGRTTRFERVLEGPTGCLRKLQIHATTLAPGAGYPPHRDAYDVGIVVLDGTVETLGRRVGPGGIVFYAAGSSHGLRNVGEVAARYVVVELHGGPSPTDEELEEALVEMRRWRQAAAELADGIGRLMPPAASLILVENGQLLVDGFLEEYRVVPFLERDGAYWGAPVDDAAALAELDRLRRCGYRYLAFAWPAFWWLDHYAEMSAGLRTDYRCIEDNERLVVFDLDDRP